MLSGTSLCGNSGIITIGSGSTMSAGSSGMLSVVSGHSYSGRSGGLLLSSGDVLSAGNSGDVALHSGTSVLGSSGVVSFASLGMLWFAVAARQVVVQALFL